MRVGVGGGAGDGGGGGVDGVVRAGVGGDGGFDSVWCEPPQNYTSAVGP